MSTGTCTNLPDLCSQARQKSALPAVGDNPRCPECGAALLRLGTAAAPSRGKMSKGMLIAVAGTMLAVAGVGLMWLKGRNMSESIPAPIAAPFGGSGTPVLRLVGSNTVGDTLAPALLQAFLAQEGYDKVEQKEEKPEEFSFEARNSKDKTALRVELAAHGSATAFTALKDGRADIGMSSRAVKKDELAALSALGDLSAQGSEYVIGIDGVAVIINPSNPITKLSTAQLRGLFSGKVNDWKDVGGKPGPVTRYVRDEKSGTRDTFKALVMDKEAFASSAKSFDDSHALSDAVAADPQGIGFVGLSSVRQARLVAVADGDSAALRPTRLTIATEDYALSRRLYYYVPGKANALARRFADFTISDLGQQVVEKAGFVGQVPEATEAQTASNVPEDYRRIASTARRLSVNLRFRAGSMQLDNKGQQDLGRIVQRLTARGATKEVVLLGFADNQGGTDCSNERLSLERAASISAELGTYGIKPSIVHGFGAAAPIASNDSETGRERNRRVEIWVSDRAVAQPTASSCGTESAPRKKPASTAAKG